MRKILGISFSKKIFAICALLALVIALIPLYRLALYAIPRYDDFSYGLNMWKAQRYGYGLRTILTVGYETALGFHYSWQGTYSSIFMMAQMPGALGYEYYFLGPVLLITSLAVSVFFMSVVLTKHYLKAETPDSIVLAVIVTLTLTECIYTAQQGFYWYNSGVHYVFMHSVMFVMVAVMVLLSRSKKIWTGLIGSLALAFLSFACAGANFVTCIQGILLLAGFMLLLGLNKSKKVFWFVPGLIIYALGLRLSLSAPGNAHRQAAYQGYGAIKSVLYSFKAGAENLWKFSGPFVILLMILAVPVILMIVKKTDHSFRHPWLFTLLSYGFYCTGYSSSFYSMGNAGLSRTWIAVSFTFQILLFANEIYWLGYLTHSKAGEKLGRVFGAGVKHYVLYYLAVFVMLLAAFHFTVDKIGAVSSFGAYYYVHTGEAFAFHQEFLERVRIIEESDHGSVEVPEYAYKPWFLINKDISEDPGEEENRIMAEYFGVRELKRVSREAFFGE